MTTSLTNVPAHIAARIAARQQAGTKSAVTSAIVGEGGGGIPRISIRASRYRLVEDGVETTVGITLDTIVIGANPRVSKVFYGQVYDSAAENTRPTCFSNDGIKPDESVDSPVNAACATCPNNQLGSKILPSGAKSKMCADQRHLAVVAAADPTKVYSFSVPVSGMKAMREYFKDLDNYGMIPEEVITQLGFDDQASYPKITFTQNGYVSAKASARVDELALSDDSKIATRQMAPNGNLLAAPVAKAAPAATPTPKPVVDEAYEEEAVSAAPAPAPAKEPKPTVASVKASSELEDKLDSLFSE
tara:strand:- start:3798 stop:4706 length:909 start_codon:yes stop_codon:yes gene_type:complete